MKFWQKNPIGRFRNWIGGVGRVLGISFYPAYLRPTDRKTPDGESVSWGCETND